MRDSMKDHMQDRRPTHWLPFKERLQPVNGKFNGMFVGRGLSLVKTADWTI